MRSRPRRNRKTESIREMVQENHVHARDLIFPLFLLEKENSRVEVDSMPGIYRLGIEWTQCRAFIDWVLKVS